MMEQKLGLLRQLRELERSGPLMLEGPSFVAQAAMEGGPVGRQGDPVLDGAGSFEVLPRGVGEKGRQGRGGLQGRGGEEERGDGKEGQPKGYRWCAVCEMTKGATAFFAGAQVCRKCEKGKKPLGKSAGADFPGGAADLRKSADGRSAPKEPRVCVQCREGKHPRAFPYGGDVCWKCKNRKKENAKKPLATSGKRGMVTSKSLMLREKPVLRPLVEMGKVNARGEFGLTVEMYKEHQRGKMDRIYSEIRKQCRPGEHQVFRLVSVKGETVETVTAGEIW